MSAGPPNREDIIAHARDILNTVDANISKAIIFGSVARGTHGPTSDVDIMVVSPDFEDVPGARRGQSFRDAWDYDQFGSVDFISYTPEEYAEYQNRPDSLIRTAEREGIPLLTEK